MYTNYNSDNIYRFGDEYEPFADTRINDYRSDVTNLEIQNDRLRMAACKTGFMNDELRPFAYRDALSVPARNIYNDPDKRTHRQRAEDLLTYSELRKLATTTINSSEEAIDEFIGILQKLKANKVFRSCKPVEDIVLKKEPSEHKDREEDGVSQLGEDYMKQAHAECITYMNHPTSPLPPVTDDSPNVTLPPVTDDSPNSF